MGSRSLDVERIARTIDVLCRRVGTRFPDSGRARARRARAGLGLPPLSRPPAVGPLPLHELVQTLEAGVNDLVFVAIGIFFLVTLESRIKRRRALAAIQELRSIAPV